MIGKQPRIRRPFRSRAGLVLRRAPGLVLLAAVSAVPWAADAPMTKTSPTVVITAGAAGVSREPGAVHFLDADRYEHLGRLPVPPNPVCASLGREEGIVYVLSAGPPGDSVDDPFGPGSLTAIDPRRRQAVATIELGTDPKGASIANDGRHLYALSGGEPGRLSRLTIIDRRTHQELASVPTGFGARSFHQSPDGRLVHVLHCDPRSVKLARPCTLVTVDGHERKVIGKQSLSVGLGQVRLSEDGKLLYVRCGGYLCGHPGEDIPARLHVVDAETGKLVASHEMGYRAGPLQLCPDCRRIFVSGRPKPEEGGVVRIVRGREIASTIRVGGRPWHVWPGRDEDSAFVLCEDCVATVDLEHQRVTHEFHLDFQPYRLLAAERGAHAYVAACDGSRLADLDLASGTVRASIAIGEQHRRRDRRGPAPSGVPGLAPCAGPETTGLRFDVAGEHLFVLDTRNDIVAVVRLEEMRVVHTIDVGRGASGLLVTPPTNQVFVQSATQLTVIDGVTRKETCRVPLGKPGRLAAGPVVFRPDRNEVLVPGARGVEVLDLATGDHLRTVTGLTNARLIVVSPAGAASPAGG